MSKSKRIESKGKPGLSRYFKEFQEGERAAIVKEPSVDSRFPMRLQGITGIVKGKKGRSYILEIKDKNKKKEILIEPIHLKKIKHPDN